jgi:arylsulfatase A-like enzyme/Flp pilus assembly protein TadD
MWNSLRCMVALLGCGAATLAWNQARRPDPASPNLLVITIDTLRPDHLECYGYKEIQTPHINSLASDGILVEHAFAPIPLTLPSHASLFTGTWPMFHGVRDFVGFTLGKERTTLAEMLKAAGYSTGAVVGSAVLEARWGLNQGFDFYYDNFPVVLERDWQPIAERRGDAVVQQALQWLDQRRNRPFFLWIHLFDPHDPYEPPAPYDRQYPDRPYDGEIAYTDENVGRILDYLKRHDLYRNSAIVLLADHGEGLGEHGEKYHGFFIYDATLRIPLIFKPAGSAVPGGRRLAGPLRIVDVVPTALQMLGLAGRVPDSEVQGRGAYSALLGKAAPADVVTYAEIFMPFYHFEWSPLTSIRQGRYKYIEAPKPELYDTQNDPREARNLYAREGAVAGKLREVLRTTATQYSSRDHSMPVRHDVDPATLEKLQSLGYLALSKGGSSAPAPNLKLPDPKDRIEVYELIRSGTIAAQQKDLERAVKSLSEAIRREPTSVVAHFQLGNVYRVAGALPQAEAEFRKTLELRPDHTIAMRRLGEVYIGSRKFKEAEAAYAKVLSVSPDDFQAHFNLGGLYVILDRWDEAVASFRRAETLNAKDARIPTIIARILLRKGDLDGALSAAERSARLDPNQPEAYLTALEVYRRQGRTAEAEKVTRILERLKRSP